MKGRNNMKKFLSLLLCVLMVFSLAACGGKNSDEVTTLKWLVFGASQPDLPKVMEKVNAIIEPEIGVKLEMQFIESGAYAERLRMNMASQGDFDLCYVNGSMYNDGVSKGGLMDILPIMKKMKSPLLEKIPDYVWDAATVDGSIYAVPNEQIFATQTGVMLRADLVEKYNFDVSTVKEFRDIEPFLAAVAAGEPDVYPMRQNFGVPALYPNIYEYNRATQTAYVLETGKTVPFVETPGFWEGVETIRDWYVKGYIRQDADTTTDDSLDYLSGNYAAYKVVIKPGVEAEEEAKLKRDLIAVPTSEPYITTDTVVATMTAVSATCKAPEKAIKFLELINTNAELYNLICYGIEGVHYDKLDTGHISLKEGSNYNPNSSWMFGCQYNALLLENQEDGIWEETAALNAGAVCSPLLGFTIDTAPIRTESAQCLAVFTEYDKILNCGSEDPSVYKGEMLSKLKQAGIDKVVAEVERQTKEFFNSKK